MGRAFRIFGRSFVRFYEELFLMVGINLIWSIGSFLIAWGLVFVLYWPLALALGPAAMLVSPWPPTVLTWVLAIFLMLTPHPLTMGVYFVARRMALERRVYFSYFWAGIKRYAWRGLGITLIGLVGYLALLANLRFYAERGTVFKAIAILWLYALVIWSGMQLYAAPLLLEQRDKSFLLVVRNAFLLTASDPIFTFILAILIVLVLLLSAVVPFILMCFSGCLIALIANGALVERLRAIRLQRGEPEPDYSEEDEGLL